MNKIVLVSAFFGLKKFNAVGILVAFTIGLITMIAFGLMYGAILHYFTKLSQKMASNSNLIVSWSFGCVLFIVLVSMSMLSMWLTNVLL